jgi:DNA-binding NarL/FixJ family response regulator
MIRILVADDHPMIRKRIRQIISEEADMEVCCEASGGWEALDLLKEQEPDLVILDINMPDLSGLETLTKIRALYTHLPVLMLTALSEGMYSTKAMKAGASGFISKESAGEELVKTIRQIIEKPNKDAERNTSGKPR